MINVTKNFDNLATNLRVLHNYFDSEFNRITFLTQLKF